MIFLNTNVFVRIAMGLALLSATTATIQAQLLVADSFAYADGPVELSSSGTWVMNYPPSNTVQILGERLYLTHAETGSVRVTFPQQVSSGSVYAKFRVTFTELPTPTGNTFAFFRQTGTDNLRARVWARTDGAAPGYFRLGLNAFSGPPTLLAADLSLGEAYTVVVRYNATNHNSTLWIDPTSESDTRWRVNFPAQVFPSIGVMHFAFMQTSNLLNTGGAGSMFVDDLRIGRTFADVTGHAALTQVKETSPGQMEISGAGAPTTNYLVQANDTLGTTNWLTLGNAVANTNGVVSFTDTNAGAFPRRFYRLQWP